jgi:diacylglycerol kinase family enzyme
MTATELIVAEDQIFGLERGVSVAILANRSAGLVSGTGSAVDEVLRALSRHAIHPRVYLAHSGRLAATVKACRAEQPDVVVVIGGDGTILAAAEAFLGTSTALAIVPQGTVNQLARDLTIALDPATAIHSLIGGVARAIDVGMVNGRIFLCTCVIGPLAKLQRYREEARGRLLATFSSFLVAAMKAVTLRPAKLLIKNGKSAWLEQTRGVIVSVNPLAEIIARVPLRERLDGNVLAVYAARERGMLTLFRMAAAILAGRARNHPHIGYHEVHGLTIDARRRWLTVLNDGELLRLQTPLRLEVMPAALRVIAPAPEAVP